MSKFNTGDTVKLKSGGPAMTVVSTVEENVQCVWFDAKQELQRKYFDQELIVEAPAAAA